MNNRDQKLYDVVIVGVGAAGSVFANILSKAGLKVLGIEYGKHFQNHRNDFVEDESGIFQLSWNNSNYSVEGNGFLGTPNLGTHVGGGTLAWTAMAFRYSQHDFQLKTLYGQPGGTSVVDWPIGYQDLEPYYKIAEEHMGVSGGTTPWDVERKITLPNPAHCYYNSSKKLELGMAKLGIRSAPGPVATNSRVYKGREACINCGFCRSGCRTDAKYQADKVMLPDAFASGNFDMITDSVVLKIIVDGQVAEGVTYFDKVSKKIHNVKAKIVIICNNPMETPRLLLNSANSNFPKGLGNNHDQVGRNFFAHPTIFGIGITNGSTDIGIGYNMGNIISLDFSKSKNTNDYIGGFSLLSLNGAGLGVIAVDPLQKLYGQELKDIMYQSPKFLAMISFCEGMPSPNNRITVVPTKLDAFGSPVAKIKYSFDDNDNKIAKKAAMTMRQILEASGAIKTFIRENPFDSHPMGGMRMGINPQTSATDSVGRVHSLKNLFVGGSSLFPTGSSVNPTLTIHALALRTSEYIINNRDKLLKTT